MNPGAVYCLCNELTTGAGETMDDGQTKHCRQRCGHSRISEIFQGIVIAYFTESVY